MNVVTVDSRDPTNRAPVDADAVVVIDVIRSTTTAVTALSEGRRCLLASSEEEALRLAAALPDALLAGEQGGITPPGWDHTNSPVAMLRDDQDQRPRPVVLLSSSGTKVIRNLGEPKDVYAASLRNQRATADYLAIRYERITIIGAQTNGEFRAEDQLCCARLAQSLVQHGFRAQDLAIEIVERWKDVAVESLAGTTSARYLQDSGQQEDLRFILDHIDDVDEVFLLRGAELVCVQGGTASGSV
ncbi:MAG: 2-phosphosulfolactate phosphatase [Actinomycetota bacterium]